MKKLFLILTAVFALLFTACDAEEDVDTSKSKITSEGIVLDGILFAKTAETTVISKQMTIVGATPSYVETATDSCYKGVFIEGRTVTLSPFVMGKYEVTQELYNTVMTNQKVIDNTGMEFTLTANPSLCIDENPDICLADGEIAKYRPVDSVSWYDAIYFCNALSEKLGLTKAYKIENIREASYEHGQIISIGSCTVSLIPNANGYRLPTEAEWEFAARGGNPIVSNWNYSFSGSDTGNVSTLENAELAYYDTQMNTGLDAVGWYCFNLGGTTSSTSIKPGNKGYGSHETGIKLANILGIYDMNGNVREWCFDTAEEISTGVEVNPINTVSSLYRISRGGSWGEYASTSSVFYRLSTRGAAGRNASQGFRVVRSIR